MIVVYNVKSYGIAMYVFVEEGVPRNPNIMHYHAVQLPRLPD